MPVARTIASVVDVLVTHPNVMNGAMMYWPEDNILYTEGYALDEWAAGRWGLAPVRTGSQRIGLVLDAGIEDELRLRHLQAADAARATLGIDIAGLETTDVPLGVELEMTPSGASWGTVKRPDSLLRASRRLRDAGCSALAIVARFPDDEDEDMLEAYRHGTGVDAVGGAEALLSHLVTQELRMPCAHAPALAPIDVDEEVSPRACAEELGYTFLPCVLANLRRAPSIVSDAHDPRGGAALWAQHVDAVVAPRSACGGNAVLSLCSRGVLLIVVEDNESAMDATPEVIGLGRGEGGGPCRVVEVSSYLEAVGVLAAHKAGIDPSTLTPKSSKLR
mmetsp:Transcript_65200/g.180798  ORF Transcript_65200/g.180798 Transcript_65200/m.180798 type:complete len:334 (-) Transcript_65200:198-1199(-)